MALSIAGRRLPSHLARQPLPSLRAAGRPRLHRQLQRRGYASGSGHDSHPKGSHWPWALGSTIVTVPAVWYLIQPRLNKEHAAHGHDSHDGHESEEPEHDDGPEKEDGQDESEDSDGEAQDTPQTTDDEESDNDDEEDESQANDGPKKLQGKKILKPDAKGGVKKRYESQNAINLGETDDEDGESSAKAAGNMNTQSGKQEGLSNTDTKHSTDIANDPDKSKKAEGVPETAKLKGTVDPSRLLR